MRTRKVSLFVSRNLLRMTQVLTAIQFCEPTNSSPSRLSIVRPKIPAAPGGPRAKHPAKRRDQPHGPLMADELSVMVYFRLVLSAGKISSISGERGFIKPSQQLFRIPRVSVGAPCAIADERTGRIGRASSNRTACRAGCPLLVVRPSLPTHIPSIFTRLFCPTDAPKTVLAV